MPPNRGALKDAVRILHWGHVAVMVLDHLDRGAHLLREKIHIDPFRQPEGGVGMTKAIGAALTAR